MQNYPHIQDLTTEEKARLTSGTNPWSIGSVPEKGLPNYTITDGPHGLRKAQDVESVEVSENVPATCFPPAAAMSSTWNPELIEQVGQTMGEECIQEGVAVILGPGVNIKRNPLGGRNFEYWSEDPYLAGHEAIGIVSGVQSQGVGTSLKHFAANNQEFDRMRVDARISQRALREIYLPAFEYIVKHAQPWTIMCSYNRINGVYSSQNRWLLTNVLRNEWGFEGIVMSDWGAVHDRVAALNAGLNLEMPPSDTDEEIVVAVREYFEQRSYNLEKFSTDPLWHIPEGVDGPASIMTAFMAMDGVQIKWLRNPEKSLVALWKELEPSLFPISLWSDYNNSAYFRS